MRLCALVYFLLMHSSKPFIPTNHFNYHNNPIRVVVAISLSVDEGSMLQELYNSPMTTVVGWTLMHCFQSLHPPNTWKILLLYDISKEAFCAMQLITRSCLDPTSFRSTIFLFSSTVPHQDFISWNLVVSLLDSPGRFSPAISEMGCWLIHLPHF